MPLDQLIRGAPIIFPPPLLVVPSSRPDLYLYRVGRVVKLQADRRKALANAKVSLAQRRGAKGRGAKGRGAKGGCASCPLQVATPFLKLYCIGFAVQNRRVVRHPPSPCGRLSLSLPQGSTPPPSLTTLAGQVLLIQSFVLSWPDF